MNEGFVIDPWIGMLFFRVCGRYDIQKLEQRTCLLRELVRRKQAKYIRDVKPLLVGKRVLIVKPKELK